MRETLSRVAGLVTGVMAGTIALASGAWAAPIGGTYSVESTNLNGSPYTDMVEITAPSDAACEIVWTTTGGSSQGVCMRDGNALAAGYRIGDGVGLVIYLIEENGTLEGHWTVAGQPGAGTEVLTPQ